VNSAGRVLSSSDRCFNKTILQEAYCSENASAFQNITCSGECRAGECKPARSVSATCEDSDGDSAGRARNYTVQGTVTLPFGSVTDFCSNSKILYEFGCTKENSRNDDNSNNPLIVFKKVRCKGGCSDGACATPAVESAGQERDL
jgi:hypothetical protein